MLELTPREAIIQTINQFVLALDDGNEDLLASVLTDDMVMDLSPFQKVGLPYEAIHGRENVVEHLMKYVGKTKDSAHHLSNFIVKFTGDQEAEVSVYALAQHFRLGEAVSTVQECYLIGNRYRIRILKKDDSESWYIKTFVVSPAWTTGNPEVMKL